MTPLWKPQQNFVRLSLDAIARNVRRFLVSSPPRTGKSRSMCVLITQLVEGGYKVILYTNRRWLIEQLCGVLDSHGIDYGIRAAGYDHDEGGIWPVQIGSLPTERSRVLRRKTWDIFAKGQRCVVLVDEAHLNNGPQDQEIFRLHVAAGHTIIGVTGTPLDLAGTYDELLVAGNVSDGFECGALVPAVHYGPDEPDIKSLKGKKPADGEDFSQSQQRKLMRNPTLFGRVWASFQQLNPDHKPTILFAPGVEESLWFAEQFTKNGVPAAHIDGDDIWFDGGLRKSDADARKWLLRASRAGEVRVIANRFVMREGIDLPWVRHVVAATVFGSLQSYLQALSRGMTMDRYEDTTALWGVKEFVTVQDHGGCLDTQTEVLTARGWVGHKDIRDDDTVAAFDRFSRSIVWKPILHRHERTLEPGEKMFEVQGRSVNIRVTGNHRFVFNKRIADGASKLWPETFEFVRADELSATNWRVQIPVSGVQRTGGARLTDDELRFIGWFVTDGTMAGARQAVSVTQANHQPQIEALRACLRGCGFDFREYRHQSKSFASKPATKFSIPKGTCRSRPRKGWWPLRSYLDKNLSRQLDLMDERQFEVFLHAVHLGDGDKGRNEGSYRISTGNKQFADNLQSLAVRKGWKCNVSTDAAGGRLNPIFVLNLQKVATTTIHGSHAATEDRQVKVVESVSLAGVTKVWCVANELETLVTRRNGMVAIIGNSWWRHGSLNADREWLLEQTAVMAYGLRADRLRNHKEEQPFLCPQCHRVWPGTGKRCSPALGGCGYVIENIKRSRPVVTEDGTLREMKGDVFTRRTVSRQPEGPQIWERMIFRGHTEKGAKTFRAAFTLYAMENNWQWPDPSWPLMPTDPRDEYRLIADVPLDRLTGSEEAKSKVRRHTEKRRLDAARGVTA